MISVTLFSVVFGCAVVSCVVGWLVSRDLRESNARAERAELRVHEMTRERDLYMAEAAKGKTFALAHDGTHLQLRESIPPSLQLTAEEEIQMLRSEYGKTTDRLRAEIEALTFDRDWWRNTAETAEGNYVLERKISLAAKDLVERTALERDEARDALEALSVHAA